MLQALWKSLAASKLHLPSDLAIPLLIICPKKASQLWLLKRAQSCLTLCEPMDCSPPDSLSMGFSRKEYWSRLPCPPPGNLPDPSTEPRSPALQADSLPSESPGKSYVHIKLVHKCSQKFIYNSYKPKTIQISILRLVNELWHIYWMKYYTATKNEYNMF